MSASPGITIGDDELGFVFSRSSGPGGQNVNSVETRVTLQFDVNRSPGLTDAQKQRIMERLATRINKDGILRVTAQRHRTREANRRAAIERFHELLAGALARPRPRHKTKVPKGVKRQRLEGKRQRAEIKRTRSKGSWD